MKTYTNDFVLAFGEVIMSFPARITYDFHENGRIVIIHDVFNLNTNKDVNGWLASTSLAFDLDLADIYSRIEDMIRDFETAGDNAVKEAKQSADIINMVTEAMGRPHHD